MDLERHREVIRKKLDKAPDVRIQVLSDAVFQVEEDVALLARIFDDRRITDVNRKSLKDLLARRAKPFKYDE